MEGPKFYLSLIEVRDLRLSYVWGGGGGLCVTRERGKGGNKMGQTVTTTGRDV